MSLQAKGMLNPADLHAAETGGFGHTTRGPMRLVARGTFQASNHHLLDLIIITLRGASGRGSSYRPSKRTFRNRERHLLTMPGQQHS